MNNLFYLPMATGGGVQISLGWHQWLVVALVLIHALWRWQKYKKDVRMLERDKSYHDSLNELRCKYWKPYVCLAFLVVVTLFVRPSAARP